MDGAIGGRVNGRRDEQFLSGTVLDPPRATETLVNSNETRFYCRQNRSLNKECMDNGNRNYDSSNFWFISTYLERNKGGLPSENCMANASKCDKASKIDYTRPSPFPQARDTKYYMVHL